MDVRSTLQAALGSSYVLERELTGGGMSRVFVAQDTTLRRKVVVKMLPPELIAGVNVERFKREILVVAQLQHPHIVPIHSAGETNGVPYFTMPYVDGESLRTRLARGPLRISEALTILRDVARALAYAHARGIVHRDIKPDNVLLSAGSAAVTDFGIAKAITEARTPVPGATLTQVGTSIGTPAYMAPEQAAADPATDHRADIYAFGCLAYELLAGRPPFIEKTPQRLLAAHMSETPQPVSELRLDVPAALADLVMRCLAKDADARPQHAGDLVVALDDVTSGGGHDAMPAILLGGRTMLGKALAIYAASFVAVAIVARAAIVAIGLPDWVFPGALIVMALGLPVILLTGYAHRVARRAVSTTPEYTPGGTPSLSQSTMATLALKASPHLSWRRATLGGVYAFGTFIVFIVGFMALRALGIGPAGSLLAAGRLGQREQLLITDFTVSNADSTLGPVVSDAVRAALAQSSAITLMPPPAIAGALRRMQKATTTRLTLPIVRDLAQREGIKAVVDGEVTGVAGGYVVAVRLLSADSAVELASFRETGEGPRGLIDAADKAARALRGRVGESLRSVQASPPLASATTSSLEALRKYSEGTRANAFETNPPKAIALLRQAVTFDSTFASAWRLLGAAMSNAGMPRASQDSAVERAYAYRARLPDRERLTLEAFYFFNGPHRDRDKAIVALQKAADEGDSTTALVNLGEVLRSRREFARAESLNLASASYRGGATIALTNAIEMQIAQGKFTDARASLDAILQRYGARASYFLRQLTLQYNLGHYDSARVMADSMRGLGERSFQLRADVDESALDLVLGRVAEWRRVRQQVVRTRAALGLAQGPLLDSLLPLYVDVKYAGASPTMVDRLDHVLERLPLQAIPLADRPYFEVAALYALAGRPDKARRIVTAYRTEVADTALQRLQQAESHGALGEIALAEGKPAVALAEFRASDREYDGYPADECGACVALELGRAFDAMSQSDSAIAMYEQFIALPAYNRYVPRIDGVNRAATLKRLGELYEAKGDIARAVERYNAFLALWRNADPDLQPRVAEVRRRLQRLGRIEKYPR